MTKRTPNWELLKDAYEIADGIPAENFNLNEWRRRDEGASCGTIACAAGWLSLHPKFRALGLDYKDVPGHGRQITFRNDYHFDAIAELFNITGAQAYQLFGQASEVPYRAHKELFLSRLRKFLERHGQLKEQIDAARFSTIG
jgi:hypothetical protein